MATETDPGLLAEDGSAIARCRTALSKSRRTLNPAVNSASVVIQYGSILGEQQFLDLVLDLDSSMQQLRAGNMDACEDMLLAQANTLQSIFTNFARRAYAQERLANLELYFRMAMKAQNQCRMTLETLANIKNPPVVYARQANIAHGHQQVNNGSPMPTHAEKTISSPNELLEAESHEQQRLDTRAPSQAGGVDPAVAALEPVNRAKNRGRQAKGKP